MMKRGAQVVFLSPDSGTTAGEQPLRNPRAGCTSAVSRVSLRRCQGKLSLPARAAVQLRSAPCLGGGRPARGTRGEPRLLSCPSRGEKGQGCRQGDCKSPVMLREHFLGRKLKVVPTSLPEVLFSQTAGLPGWEEARRDLVWTASGAEHLEGHWRCHRQPGLL